MAKRSAEFSFGVNNVLVAVEDFNSVVRFWRCGYQVEIAFSSENASLHTAIEMVDERKVVVEGKLVRFITVTVLGESPFQRLDSGDEDYETDEAAEERIDFLKRALPIAEAVSWDFFEWVRLRQPWLGVHGQRPERSGGPVLRTDRSEHNYGSQVLPIASPGARTYSEAFLDRSGLDALIPLLNDKRPNLPQGETLLADARYFLSSEPPDLQRAVLTAAIGCEVKIKQTLRTKAPAESIKLINLLLENPRDFSLAACSLFDKGTEAALGRSLRSDNRQLYNRVTKLFELRNKIAHKGETPPAAVAGDMIAAAQEAFRWLDKL